MRPAVSVDVLGQLLFGHPARGGVVVSACLFLLEARGLRLCRKGWMSLQSSQQEGILVWVHSELLTWWTRRWKAPLARSGSPPSTDKCSRPLQPTPHEERALVRTPLVDGVGCEAVHGILVWD